MLAAKDPEYLVARFIQIAQDMLSTYWIVTLPMPVLFLRLIFLRTGFLLYDPLVFIAYE